MKQLLSESGMIQDAEFLPNVDRDAKIAFLQGLTIFSVPAVYGESFGLYVIEAMAAGVPVVQPRHAAFPEIVSSSGGGLLYEPFDEMPLADKIEELLLDPDRSRAIGEHGRAAVRRDFTVDRMAEKVAAIFEVACARRVAYGVRV
jgi:glycosyltransferase involved in cell wall biosynthesis